MGLNRRLKILRKNWIHSNSSAWILSKECPDKEWGEWWGLNPRPLEPQSLPSLFLSSEKFSRKIFRQSKRLSCAIIFTASYSGLQTPVQTFEKSANSRTVICTEFFQNLCRLMEDSVYLACLLPEGPRNSSGNAVVTFFERGWWWKRIVAVIKTQSPVKIMD